jgi:hypothetical protein
MLKGNLFCCPLFHFLSLHLPTLHPHHYLSPALPCATTALPCSSSPCHLVLPRTRRPLRLQRWCYSSPLPAPLCSSSGATMAVRLGACLEDAQAPTTGDSSAPRSSPASSLLLHLRPVAPSLSIDGPLRSDPVTVRPPLPSSNTNQSANGSGG